MRKSESMEKNRITFEDFKKRVYKEMIERNLHRATEEEIIDYLKSEEESIKSSYEWNKDFDGALEYIISDIVYALDLDF